VTPDHSGDALARDTRAEHFRSVLGAPAILVGMRPTRPLALALLLAVSAAAAEEPSVRVATWNLENLFDAEDDPAREDPAPAPPKPPEKEKTAAEEESAEPAGPGADPGKKGETGNEVRVERPRTDAGSEEEGEAEADLRTEYTGPVAPPEERERLPIREHDFFIVFYWDRGISYESRTSLGRMKGEELAELAKRWDEGVQLQGRIGVKFALDGAVFGEHGDVAEMDDRVEIRRFFIYTTGEFFFLAPVYYKLEFGAITGDLVLNQAYFWFQDVPYVGSLQFGHFDAPFSLDAMMSSRDISLMEVASPVSAFAPGVKFGVQASGTASEDDRFTASVGWFADGQDVGKAGRGSRRWFLR